MPFLPMSHSSEQNLPSKQIANIKSDEGLSFMGDYMTCDVYAAFVHVAFTCLKIVQVVVDPSFSAGKSSHQTN